MSSLSIASDPAVTLGDPSARPEGVAFAPDGLLLAVAESGADRISFFRRTPDGAGYGPDPDATIEGPPSGLAYPHDVAFSPDGRLLAVANRDAPSITLYARRSGDAYERFDGTPVETIAGPASKLVYTDEVAFLPPSGEFLAASNASKSSVVYFRRRRPGGLRRAPFTSRPSFVLRGPVTRMAWPDGLAFSPDGALLAVPNHRTDAVTIYARAGRGPVFVEAPVGEIGGPSARLRCPHSVVFTSDAGHLVVSNAGGRTVTIFRRSDDGGRAGSSWSAEPVLEVESCLSRRFEEVNPSMPLEGGGKGVAIGDGFLAICNSDFGVRLHRLDEGARAPRTQELAVIGAPR